MKKFKFKVTVVNVFKGFGIIDEIMTNSLKEFRGTRLSKAEYEGWDDEADTIEFEYDEVIIDNDDDCIFYYIKQL